MECFACCLQFILFILFQGGVVFITWHASALHKDNLLWMTLHFAKLKLCSVWNRLWLGGKAMTSKRYLDPNEPCEEGTLRDLSE
jgi:hypothetical protein